MTDPNVFPSKRSASARIGQPFRIQQKDFFRVHDQQYPWVGMRHDSPSQWQRGKDLQVAQKREVDHYLVIREQYWALFDRRMYGTETVAKVSIEQGTTYSHKEAHRESTTSRFAASLGLNLTGNIFDAALGGSSLSPNFNYEFSHALEFTETDEMTYRETKIHSIETKFVSDTQYLCWQICNDVLLYRIIQQQADSEVIASSAFINRVASRTSKFYVQPFAMGPSTAANPQTRNPTKGPPMSGHTTLKPGESRVYSTRPVGRGTTLFAQCSDKGDSVLGWHIELCCKRLNKQRLEAGQPWQTSISEGRGALVAVSNQGFNDIEVWTDY